MFGSESFLHGSYRLSHGTRRIEQRIAYWYTIHCAIHSMSIRKQLGVDHHGHFMDGYIDDFTIKKYKEHFDYSFFQKFFCLSNESVNYRSRYKTGPVVYHSLIYSFRKQPSSYNVCVNGCDCPKKLCYGEISRIDIICFCFSFLILILCLKYFHLLFKLINIYLCDLNSLIVFILLFLRMLLISPFLTVQHCVLNVFPILSVMIVFLLVHLLKMNLNTIERRKNDTH